MILASEADVFGQPVEKDAMAAATERAPRRIGERPSDMVDSG